MRAGSGSANLDRPIPADSYQPDPLTMPKIPIVSQVVNLKDQKVRAAAYVVNTPGAWLPDPEIIGQRPKSRSKSDKISLP
jgi:hypothetical protein